jgi:hypothetical protein
MAGILLMKTVFCYLYGAFNGRNSDRCRTLRGFIESGFKSPSVSISGKP